MHLVSWEHISPYPIGGSKEPCPQSTDWLTYESGMSNVGGFSRFPFGFALARVSVSQPNRVHCHWKGEIFLLVRIARGRRRRWQCISTFLLLRRGSGGQFSERFRKVNATSQWWFTQPRSEMSSSICKWRARSLCGQNGATRRPPLQSTADQLWKDDR